jgi:uncharacterized repeat protein (TIGR03803 family)
MPQHSLPRKSKSFEMRTALRTVLTSLGAGTLALVQVAGASAQANEKMVHIFGTASSGYALGGYNPYGGVILDSAGNLYGTAAYGGSHGYGMVFEMLKGANGQWTEKALFNFGDVADDGAYAPLAGLVFDRAGNLFGTTLGGGGSADQYGTVFELSPTASGKWTFKIVHVFGGTDGQQPRSPLTMDSAGDLYGTTSENGLYGKGTVFKLTRGAGGVWTEETVYSFGAVSGDGGYSFEPVAIDSSGNIWGTSQQLGAYGFGAIYEISPNSSGGWTETIVHSFAGGTDGAYPECGFIFDAAGNLYGTTTYGGSSSHGIIFELSPAVGGGWTMTTLYNFDGTDGYDAMGNLAFGPDGTLYGTTWSGGAYGQGNVFALKPSVGGTWSAKNLHSFQGGQGGCDPWSGVALDSAGNLYGTTLYCGIGQGFNGVGTVFEIVPQR